MPTTKWVTGTATDDQDLYAKLITFLTTDTDLVSAGEEWTEVWDHDDGDEAGIVLQGPGLAGTDEIYIGLRLVRDVGADSYAIEVSGMTGYQDGGEEMGDHVNVSPQPVRSFADSGSMTYWFIASGRHFIVVTKISTIFEALYAGWFLPFGTPSEYPYPMFIGGSAGPEQTHSSSPKSWRDDVTGHSLFPWPSFNTFSGYLYNSSAHVLSPSGDWLELSNSNEFSDGTVGPFVTRGNRYTEGGDTTGVFPPSPTHKNQMDCYGGDKMIHPVTLHRIDSGNQTYGVLDGVFRCQGVGIGAEDKITVDSVDHLVVQNAFRTAFDDYFCVELS
jgi:hypothetical protein